MGKEIMNGKLTPDSTVTLTNKTIAYDSNTLTGVAGTSATQTLTNKTMSLSDNNITGTASKLVVTDSTGKVTTSSSSEADLVTASGTQTLTNKTISYADNTLTGVQPTITGGASSITSSNLTASKVLVSDASGKVAAGTIDSSKIVSTDGAQTLTNKTIDAKDNTVKCTPTVISTTQTITPTKNMSLVIDTSNITVTLGDGPYDGFVLPIITQADCTLIYAGSDATKTATIPEGNSVKLTWNDDYWMLEVYSVVEGTDAQGNSFSYGSNVEVSTKSSSEIVNLIYPVGSIYMSVNNVSPTNLFGGTWEQIKDTFLLSAGDTYSAGSTGGEATHTLTVDEMPSHTHIQNSHNHEMEYTGTSGTGFGLVDSQSARSSGMRYTSGTTATNQNTGGGQAHNNMPPYLVVYVWKRTA